MGIGLAARKIGGNDFTRRTLRRACQFNPRSKARATAFRQLRPALGKNLFEEILHGDP
jgi:hypothetical protein